MYFILLGDRFLEHRVRQAEELQKLLRSNFTEQMHLTKLELEGAQKDRIRYQLEGIELRRDKAFLEERINMYEKKCKEDFVQSLEGIPNVTREFLKGSMTCSPSTSLFSSHATNKAFSWRASVPTAAAFRQRWRPSFRPIWTK